MVLSILVHQSLVCPRKKKMDIKEKFSKPIRHDPVITEADVDTYLENGYLIVHDLLSKEEVQEINDDIFTILRGRYNIKNIPVPPVGISDKELLDTILAIHQPHYFSPIMEKYTVKHKKICGVLSQITGAHLPYWDNSVKCMQSMLFVKPPGFQGQCWHQDEKYIPTRDRSLTATWIALDDISPENGGLWVIPKSHQYGFIYPWKPHNNRDEYDDHDDVSVGFDKSKMVPVECKAGSVLFFNGYTLHQSLKNRSTDSYRRVLTCHYMNSWSLLPWGVVTEKNRSVAIEDRRNVTPVSGTDPYAWKGYADLESSDVYVRNCKAIDKMDDKMSYKIQSHILGDLHKRNRVMDYDIIGPDAEKIKKEIDKA